MYVAVQCIMSHVNDYCLWFLGNLCMLLYSGYGLYFLCNL